jgi:small subunit ribosomal protein S16
MSVRIRFSRTGTLCKPSFRIVVTDVRSQRNGMTIETVGFYNPVRKEKKIDVERVDYWIGKGAKMTPSVRDMYRAHGGTNVKAVSKIRKRPLNAPPKPKKEPEKKA